MIETVQILHRNILEVLITVLCCLAWGAGLKVIRMKARMDEVEAAGTLFNKSPTQPRTNTPHQQVCM